MAGTPYLVATVLRPQGAIYLVKGGAFINWTLLWVDESNTGSNVYPAISGSALAFTCDYLRVRDLPGAWQQDYGIATSRTASADANATGTVTGDTDQLNGLIDDAWLRIG